MTDIRHPAAGPAPKYQRLMEIGRGGMGVVHLAMCRDPGGSVKLVVLKMLQLQLVGNRDAQRMFLEEARISARLTHPNVVQVYEIVQHDGVPTMVMEYLEGQSLSSVLGDSPGRLPLELYVYVLSRILAGLHAAHELRDYDGRLLNLVHRDVSPPNVFLLFDGQVKVLDFGIAKSDGSTQRTRTGELKGKIRYMAPEQLMGVAQDRRADLFAVGVMLWEALARRRMWEGMNDGDVMLGLLSRAIPTLPDVSELPPGLARICAKAISPASKDRFATAAEMQRELEWELEHLSARGGAESLGRYLVEHFGAARETTKQAIEIHVKGAERSSERERELGNGELWGEQTLSAVKRAPSVDGALVKSTGAQGLAGGFRTRGLRVAGFSALAVAAVGAVCAAVFLPHGVRKVEAPQGSNIAVSGLHRVDRGPTQVCGSGYKLCGGACVTLDRPDFGCGSDDCVACDVPNAAAGCNAQQRCDIAACFRDYRNCDSDIQNGCEVEVRVDPNHCGSCGHRCGALPHAQPGCGDVCTIWRCEDGYRDCNGAVNDGCEVRTLDDERNCGHCGAACGTGQRCRSGRCVR